MKKLILVLSLVGLFVPANAQQVVIKYERADGAFAPAGKSTAVPGPETVTLTPGQILEFDTDWKYEKKKGTVSQHYGSHLRKVTNTSDYNVTLYLRVGPTNEKAEILPPGVTRTFKADLIAIEAGEQPLSKAALSKRCILEYQRADNAGNMKGLPSASLGKESLTLKPGESIFFDTDWKYEKKKSTTTSRYGSHLRRAVNKGEGTTIRVTSVANFMQQVSQGFTRGILAVIRRPYRGGVALEFNKPQDFQADLVKVDCLAK